MSIEPFVEYIHAVFDDSVVEATTEVSEDEIAFFQQTIVGILHIRVSLWAYEETLGMLSMDVEFHEYDGGAHVLKSFSQSDFDALESVRTSLAWGTLKLVDIEGSYHPVLQRNEPLEAELSFDAQDLERIAQMLFLLVSEASTVALNIAALAGNVTASNEQKELLCMEPEGSVH